MKGILGFLTAGGRCRYDLRHGYEATEAWASVRRPGSDRRSPGAVGFVTGYRPTCVRRSTASEMKDELEHVG